MMRLAHPPDARTEEGFRPYRRLAVRVLARALSDLADPGSSTADRETARAFFAGSGMLAHWCRVAALDPGRVARRAHRLGQRARPVTRALASA
jgi:hypothetical protein